MLFPGSERREKPAVGARCSSGIVHTKPQSLTLYLTRPSYPLGCASSSLLTRGFKRLCCLIGSFGYSSTVKMSARPYCEARMG